MLSVRVVSLLGVSVAHGGGRYPGDEDQESSGQGLSDSLKHGRDGRWGQELSEASETFRMGGARGTRVEP